MPCKLFYDRPRSAPATSRPHPVDYMLLHVPFDRIPTYVHGGCVIPRSVECANTTTTELRKKSFEIIVAPGLDHKAQGSLYLDDGERLDGGSKKTRGSVGIRDQGDNYLHLRKVSRCLRMPVSRLKPSRSAAGIANRNGGGGSDIALEWQQSTAY